MFLLIVFDSIVSKKLSESLSQNYYKCLSGIVFRLRNELVFTGRISVDFIDSISFEVYSHPTKSLNKR